MDELDARIRALEAERMRPVPPPEPIRRVPLGDLVELCDALGEDDDEPEEP
jgi:hypothetical protein